MTQTTYRILFLGDFHFGESYGRSGARVLANKGYEHSLRYLRPFADSADHFIANLETPLLDPAEMPSPLRGSKTYIHWADPIETPKYLKQIGVDAVSLANNHTLDHGQDGLQSTFKALSVNKIPWFGAGQDAKEAREPHRVDLPDEVGGGSIYVHGFFQYSTGHDKKFGFYARRNTPGCASLSRKALMNGNVRRGAENSYHVAFPHWGANYKWAGDWQRSLSELMLGQGFDLVLGHGSHCIQEIELKKDRWVCYSIGNGHFLSVGRFDKYVKENGILPMGMWTMLHVDLTSSGERRMHARLYPVYSDNNVTNFQPRPVDESDFYRAMERLGRKAASPSGLVESSPSDIGRDELGWYFKIDLGNWPVSGPPANLRAASGAAIGSEATIDDAAPDSLGQARGIYNDPDSLYIRQQQTERGRNVAPLLISRAAERQGAKTEWVADRVAILRKGDRRVLLQGHRGGESELGKMIISDKYLTKRFLMSAGVSTPRGELALTADDAVEIHARFGTPIVIKPRFGQKGRAVSVNLNSEAEIRAAFGRADSMKGGVVVEEYVEIEEEFRCLSTPSECVSVVRRILPNVTGDGVSTILELITAKNEQRKLNPSTFGRPTPTDVVTATYLEKSGLSFDYVPQNGESLTVRDVGGLSSGGEPHECSNLVSDALKSTAANAIAAIPGLTWGGADVMTSREDGKPYVIEINSDADISGASFPYYGEPASVADVLWESRYENATPDFTGQPGIPEVKNPGQRVEAMVPEAWGEQNSTQMIKLQPLMKALLTRAGYVVDVESDKVIRVSGSNLPEPLWLAEGEGDQDVATVSEVLKRHRIVRRLLRLAEVPRTRQDNIAKWSGFQRFLSRKSAGELVLTPFGGAWGGANTRKYDSPEQVDQSLFDRGVTWIVQSRPAGTRLTVFATPHAGDAVFGDAKLVNNALVQAAVEVAVKGIRSVPGLRWGFVSVIVDSSSSALVEGITRAPVFDRSTVLLAGDVAKIIDPMLR
ncbi:MAG: CapA family protein [Micrococcaceae bacterium]